MYQMLIFMGTCVAFGILFIIIQELQDRCKPIQQPYARYRNYMVLEDGTILYPKREEVNSNGQHVDIVIN